jgi:hypothetical protein
MRLLRKMVVLGCVLSLAACNNDEVWQTDGPSDIPQDEDNPPGPTGGWSAEVVTDGAQNTGIAVDSDGKVHISSYDGAGLIYAGGRAADWHVALLDGGLVDLGEGNDIAVGPDKIPQVSYRASQTEIRLARMSGTNWVILTVATGGHIGPQTAIAVDADNRPHVVYYDERERFLKYAVLNGDTWTRESVAELDNWEQRVDIAVDGQGRPHVSFQGFAESKWSVKYATRTAGGWQVATVDADGDLSHPSIAVDSAGNPHISYYQISDSTNSTTRDLKYAVWVGSAWAISTVDREGDVGNYSSIAVDSAGHPHISYVDYSNRALKYAHHGGTSWSKVTVDRNSPSRGVAWQTAIAVDGQNHPHISYFDWFGDKLMYAHK